MKLLIAVGLTAALAACTAGSTPTPPSPTAVRAIVAQPTSTPPAQTAPPAQAPTAPSTNAGAATPASPARPTATVAAATSQPLPSSPTARPTTLPATTPPTTSAAPLTPTAGVQPIGTARTASVSVDVVATGLDTPWALAFAADGRAFLTERPGRVRLLRDGKLQLEPWATFEVHERDREEAGLLGLALDPAFAQSGYVYVAYTYRDGTNLRNRLVRLRDDPSTGRGVVDRVLLDGVLGAGNHDGGRVAFGPDGKLYWTVGEAFIAALAQDRNNPSGKILRLNSDGSIPNDNPFPGSPVYSLGHRNPQGLAWQPGTGRLYATEHGPSGNQGCCHDEVNLIEPGKNYGWPEIRGDQTAPGLLGPVVHSGPSVTWAPGGATFATSGLWQGSLLFAGLRGQALYRVTLDPNQPRATLGLEVLLEGKYGRLRDVVQGPDGAVYLLTSNRDGRGVPTADDDRVLRLRISA